MINTTTPYVHPLVSVDSWLYEFIIRLPRAVVGVGIGRYLSHKEKQAFRLVCKKFREYFDTFGWRQYIPQDRIKAIDDMYGPLSILPPDFYGVWVPPTHTLDLAAIYSLGEEVQFISINKSERFLFMETEDMLKMFRDLPSNIQHVELIYNCQEMTEVFFMHLVLSFPKITFTFGGDIDILYHCCRRGYKLLIPEVIKRRDPNIPYRMSTPLTNAIQQNQYEVAELLLKNGADPNIVVPNNGFTALIIAIYAHQIDMVSLLLTHGADPNKGNPLYSVVYLADEMMKDMLVKNAIPRRLIQLVEKDCIRTELELIRLLLGKGADPHAKTSGKSALMIAMASRSNELRNLFGLPDD